MMSMQPTVSAKEALSWATVEGARALGMADRIGRIEPRMQADLVAIDARTISLIPVHDPIAAVLKAGSGDVESVIIAGVWRKRDHRLLAVGLDDLKNNLIESSHRLLSATDDCRETDK
jgi:5-methylthioadenosine/S-adenosylhomocysteine deaminase